MTRFLALQRQEPVEEDAVAAELGGSAGETDRPLFEHIDAIGKGEREIDTLLGEQNGEALRL